MTTGQIREKVDHYNSLSPHQHCFHFSVPPIIIIILRTLQPLKHGQEATLRAGKKLLEKEG